MNWVCSEQLWTKASRSDFYGLYEKKRKVEIEKARLCQRCQDLSRIKPLMRGKEKYSHLTSHQYSDLVESVKTICMFAWKYLHPEGLQSQLCRRQRNQSRLTLPVSEKELPSSNSNPPLSNTQQLFACNNTCLWKSDITVHTDDLSAK